MTLEIILKMKSKSKGLGDKIAAVTKVTGIEKVVKTFFGDDCGCDERRDRLNKMFPNAGTQETIKKTRTSCSSCNKGMYIELLKVYESSCTNE